MSYRSLLFCPDEKTARVVTQVLSELDFTVEAANEPYAAVKKLNDERFDALVVDCQTEQDAALLFKTARDSSQNHSSLSVAVVDGQAGVAKAFRIGANLVLTKPINVEQSKGTLRVARGLLRKNDGKPGTGSAQAPAKTAQQAAPITSARAGSPIAEHPSSSSVADVNVANQPFKAFEAEPEPTPEPEAADVAVLESLPGLSGQSSPQSLPAPVRTDAQPIAAGTSGQAAAVAPALEKADSVGLKAATLPPMVTNEPIVESQFSDSFARPEPEAPTFSSANYAGQGSGSGIKFIKIAAILLVVGVSGYFGWQKLHPLQYLQHLRATHSAAGRQSAQSAAATPVPVEVPALPKSEPEPSAATQPEIEISATPSHPAAEGDDSDDIEVQELPMSRDAKVSSATNAKPLVVKPDTGTTKKPAKSQIAPPTVQVSAVNVAAPAMPNLAEPAPELPRLAPGSLRISQGVSQGLILKKVPPVYPQMALQLHKEGAVELLATISKQGAITAVKVLSGDAMLAKPAVDAVKQWKYRPYLLNGEPVEIQTQITINFTSPR